MDHVVARLADMTDKPLGRGRSFSGLLGGWIKHSVILGVAPSVAERSAADTLHSLQSSFETRGGTRGTRHSTPSPLKHSQPERSLPAGLSTELPFTFC